MRRFLGFALCALMAVLSVAATAQDLVGRWYGEGYQHRVYMHWLVDRRPDGSFSAEFRRYEDCKLVMQQQEVGRWRLEGNTYSTQTHVIDGRMVFFRDSYILQSVENGVMSYMHMASGTKFSARRVGGEFFDWPVCDPSKLTS